MVEPWWSVLSRAASVTAAPVLQVAADGRWEAADVVPVTADPSPARAAIERVAAAGGDVAVEILWPGQAFVGVRWPADRWERAAAAAGRVLAGSPVPPSRTVQAGLLALLGTTPGTEVEWVELGAVNAWQSVGPQRLWRRGAVLTARAVDSALEGRPDLSNCLHPVAVEFAVTSPQPCWVGIYVSTGSDPIQLRRLKSVLRGVVPGGLDRDAM